jgi:hypothetical protein
MFKHINGNSDEINLRNYYFRVKLYNEAIRNRHLIARFLKCEVYLYLLRASLKIS